MTFTKADASLVIDTRATVELFAAYEHQAQFAIDKPPEVIFVGVCKLAEVYRLMDGRRNTEWMRIFAAGGSVMVRIIAVGDDKMEVRKFAMQHARSLPSLPRCNSHGVNVKGMARRVRCSNGVVYDTQKEAATALGVSSSALSRHMRGDLNSVGGFTFQYEGVSVAPTVAA